MTESSVQLVLRRAAAQAAAGRIDRHGDELATVLYSRWYTGWLDDYGQAHHDATEPFVASTSALAMVPGSSRDLTGALRWAHAGSRRFEPGWRAERVSSTGRVVASRHGEARLLDTADYVTTGRAGLPPRVDGDLSAAARRDSIEASPGFWLTVGPDWPSVGTVDGLVRVYWNVRGEDAPALVHALTSALLDGPATWALKLPVDLAQHVRRDSAVLYIRAADFSLHAPVLAMVAALMRDRFVPEEPALTLRLAPGIGLAEDPGGEESFGSSRCALVAEGLAAAPGDDVDSLLTSVLLRLRVAGLDPDRPHLEPGSRWIYEFPAPRPPPPHLASPALGRPAVALPVAGADHFLAGARCVAGQLVDQAVWHEGRCTWIGDTIIPDGATWVVAAQTCGGDVYGGTAGVGRFLAQWAAATADAAAARTAAGALRHAIRAARGHRLTAGGIFLGPLGTAWAALDAAGLLDAADLLDDAELRGDGHRLARDACVAIGHEPIGADDLLAGEAGAIVGLLAIAESCGEDESWVDAARASAARLVAAANRSGLGWHWPGEQAASPYGLCGLAHGTSGIALALQWLHARTGDDAHLDAARQALAYERRWYRGEAVGWPDLREMTGADLALGRDIAHPAFWCHGAVGAGLVHLLGFTQYGDEASAAAAGATLLAARTAAALALRELAEPDQESGTWPNWSVCHGILGTAELMLCAASRLGEPAHLDAARRLGERALADRSTYGAWRCGVRGGGETPGLLLGLAGIGTTLLRLHDPGLAPSPALPGIDRLADAQQYRL